MSLPPLRDLQPREDVKGGSPKTPYPSIPMSSIPPQEYQPQMIVKSNGIAGWMVAIAEAGLLAGAIGMWFTALQSRGINQEELRRSEREMREYVDKFQHDIIIPQQAKQDQDIGELKALLRRVDQVEFEQKNNGKEFEALRTDSDNKIKLATSYMEELRKMKK